MAPNARPLVDFFSRSLAGFQSSQETFRVLCTLPHTGDPAPRRPSRRVSRLIVLDSSFNPPTTAHAQMAASALEEATGDTTITGTGTGSEADADTRLMLLLAVNNADKAPKPAGFPSRLGMMEAFGRGLLRELRQRGPQIDVAVTTMPFFHDKAGAVARSGFYGGGGDDDDAPEQIYLTGFDTLVRVLDPKYYTANTATTDPSPAGRAAMRAALTPFFARARLRVTMRPGGAWGSLEDQRDFVRALEEAGGEEARWVAGRRVEVAEGLAGDDGSSSSMVRDLAAEGRALDGLVGREVREWIEEEELYRER